MSGNDLTKFQKDSVESIMKHFYPDPDKEGNTNTSKYLLADEVGLGKTLVARGVIEEVRKKWAGDKKEGEVFYVCGNLQLAQQNLRKLESYREMHILKDFMYKFKTDRLSMLFLQTLYMKEWISVISRIMEIEKCLNKLCSDGLYESFKDAFTQSRWAKYNVGKLKKNTIDKLKGKLNFNPEEIKEFKDDLTFINSGNKYMETTIAQIIMELHEISKKQEPENQETQDLINIKSPVYTLTPKTSLDNSGSGCFIERFAVGYYVYRNYVNSKINNHDEDAGKYIDVIIEYVRGTKGDKNGEKIEKIRKHIKYIFGLSNEYVYVEPDDEIRVLPVIKSLVNKIVKEKIIPDVGNFNEDYFKDKETFKKKIADNVLNAFKTALFNDKKTDEETGKEYLVIIDEFQNYSSIFETDYNKKTKNSKLSNEKKLLEEFLNVDNNANTKVLLLSATPFHYTTELKKQNKGDIKNSPEGVEYYLEVILKYIMGDKFGDWETLINARNKAIYENKENFVKTTTAAIQDLMRNCGISRVERKQVLNGENQKYKKYISLFEKCDEKKKIELIKNDLQEQLGQELYEFYDEFYDDFEEADEGKSDNKAKNDKVKISLQYITDTPWVCSFGEGYENIKSEYENLILEYDSINKYEEIKTENLKFNLLMDYLFKDGVEKLLFIPPSCPHYPLKGIFEDFDKDKFFSKTLIFAKYYHTTNSLGGMLSYFSEQKNYSSLPKEKKTFKYWEENEKYEYIKDEPIKDGYIDDVKKISDTDLNKILGDQIKEEIKRYRDLKKDEKYNYNSIIKDNRMYEDNKTIFMCGSLVAYVFDRFGESITCYNDSFNNKGLEPAIRKLYKYFFGKEAYMIITTCDGDCYFDKIHRYCADGNIRAVLDEYLFLEKEDDNNNTKDLTIFINSINSLGFNQETKSVCLCPNYINKVKCNLRNSFAYCAKGEDAKNVESSEESIEKKRATFQSPFRPFVYVSTQFGAEGFDFHWYCRNVVHWVPERNPEKMQQKEGRIDRYHCHYVRQNIARDYAKDNNEEQSYGEWADKVWPDMFDKARDMFNEARKKYSENTSNKNNVNALLRPDWIYEGKDKSKIYSTLNVYNVFPPASREERIYNTSRKNVGLYRLIFGSDDNSWNNNDSLPENADNFTEDCFIDLYPYPDKNKE